MVIFSELSLIPNFSKTQNIQYVAQFNFADKEFAKYVDTILIALKFLRAPEVRNV